MSVNAEDSAIPGIDNDECPYQVTDVEQSEKFTATLLAKRRKRVKGDDGKLKLLPYVLIHLISLISLTLDLGRCQLTFYTK